MTALDNKTVVPREVYCLAKIDMVSLHLSTHLDVRSYLDTAQETGRLS